MSEQPGLFDASDFNFRPLVDIDAMPGCSHSEKARAFHVKNPQVYEACVKLARRMVARGYEHYSIKAIWEVVRFMAIETTGTPYKLCNNYHAWYAREIMKSERDLDGFFTLRASAHDPEFFAADGDQS